MKRKQGTAYTRHFLYSLIAGLIIGISALTLYLLQAKMRPPARIDAGHFTVEGDASFDGLIPIQPPIPLPDFTLANVEGAETSLSDLRGRFVLLTFGFTNCPDICPLTLNDFEQISDMLGDLSRQAAFLFISVDGRRDTPQALRRYFEFRGMEGLIALTGDEALVRRIGAPLGLAFEVVGDEATGAYSVNHSAGSYLLDPEGRWVMRYQFGVPPSRIAADIARLLTS
ncbi:MAG: SCO family protein [Chloroflexi bacterium]|nr:SCO family protein [Chloroflexota bacterium]